MIDRSSKYPGRIKLNPVLGKSDIFDVEMADEASVEGTAIEKATMLDDDNAVAYGLAPETATPNDAFKVARSTFANAFTKTVSAPVVAVDGVSPVEHQVGCKVTRVAPGTKVLAYGRNLFNPNWLVNYQQSGLTVRRKGDTIRITGTADRSLYDQLISIGVDSKRETPPEWRGKMLRFQSQGAQKIEIVVRFLASSGDTYDYISIKDASVLVPRDSDRWQLRMLYEKGVTYDETITVQVCDANVKDDTIIPYVPPVELTPDETGVVKGVPYNYPTITLMLKGENTAGEIEATYNQDSRAALNQVEQKIPLDEVMQLGEDVARKAGRVIFAQTGDYSTTYAKWQKYSADDIHWLGYEILNIPDFAVGDTVIVPGTISDQSNKKIIMMGVVSRLVSDGSCYIRGIALFAGI